MFRPAGSKNLEHLDLWAPVARDALPTELCSAFTASDWARVKSELTKVMDGITTDGAYGRALLQVALELPIGIDPVFDSYRGAASIDHGDWDGLRRCITGAPIAPAQLLGMRDVLLGPLNRTDVPPGSGEYTMHLQGYEDQFSQLARQLRHWARRMLKFQVNEVIWASNANFRVRRPAAFVC